MLQLFEHSIAGQNGELLQPGVSAWPASPPNVLSAPALCACPQAPQRCWFQRLGCIVSHFWCIPFLCIPSATILQVFCSSSLKVRHPEVGCSLSNSFISDAKDSVVARATHRRETAKARLHQPRLLTHHLGALLSNCRVCLLCHNRLHYLRQCPSTVRLQTKLPVLLVRAGRPSSSERSTPPSSLSVIS